MTIEKTPHEVKFDEQCVLIPFDSWCPYCGAGHCDGPGDDSTWLCRRCQRPCPRSVSLTADDLRKRGING